MYCICRKINGKFEFTGPEKWPQQFPTAAGVRQSPIDITPDITMYDPGLANGKFVFNYHPYDCTQLINKGTTWSITIKEDSFSSNCNCSVQITFLMLDTSFLAITATHLPGTYKLIDVHGHWGNDPTCGSEHLIAGEAYSAEVSKKSCGTQRLMRKIKFYFLFILDSHCAYEHQV